MQKIDKTDVLKKILSGRRFTVYYFQREYRWGRKQIEQMISDFQGTFEVAEADGEGATKWGKLKSGAGWISLNFL